MPLRLAEAPGTNGEVIVEGATSVSVEDAGEVRALLAAAERRRVVANQALNATSSRSHAILTVNIVRRGGPKASDASGSQGVDPGAKPELAVYTRSKLVLVDLAGSERVKDSGSTGASLGEAVHINSSLTALGKCIHALAEMAERAERSSHTRGFHVPYRDSKLTRLLKDCFGGSARTSLVVTCSLDPRHVGETVTTMRFGQRAMRVGRHAPASPMKPRGRDHSAVETPLKKAARAFLPAFPRYPRERAEHPPRPA